MAVIATATAAATTTIQRRNGNATVTVMEAYHQRRASRGLSPKQISAMSTLVAERSEAMAATDYNCADEIFDSLSREYGINIEDRAGEWALVHEEYPFNPDVSSFVPGKDVLWAIKKRLRRGYSCQSAGTLTWPTTYATSSGTSTWWRLMTRTRSGWW